MSEEPFDSVGDESDDEIEQKALVERERAEIREFVAGLSAHDVRSGGWFTKLLAQSLQTYTEKADWEYFQTRYHGVPADAIVEQRIKMAANYAAIEGGLSAAAYTGAVAATIGSLGGASPITAPAAAISILVDVAYVTQLQLKLAYDISVLYRVPLDISDPDDLWRLVRVAFTIKSAEVAREGVVKFVPLLMRPLIKRFYSRSVLTTAKALPVVGRHLLQRNAIKVGLPLVGVPLAIVVNRYTTLLAGRHAVVVFRNEARVKELAERLSEASQHPQLALWVAWLMVTADGDIDNEEALFMRHLVRFLTEHHQVTDEKLAQLVDLDRNEVWRRVESESGDLSDVVEFATQVATVDGALNQREREILSELRKRCERP